MKWTEKPRTWKERMKDKNEFRTMEKKDTVEGRKWYHDVIETIREDLESMLEMVIKER